MKRKEAMRIHISRIVENCSCEELYYLLYQLQDIDIMYGYAVAMLMAFEDKKIGTRKDDEVSDMMKNGEYYKLFSEWLSEDLS